MTRICSCALSLFLLSFVSDLACAQTQQEALAALNSALNTKASALWMAINAQQARDNCTDSWELDLGDEAYAAGDQHMQPAELYFNTADDAYDSGDYAVAIQIAALAEAQYFAAFVDYTDAHYHYVLGHGSSGN